MVNLLRVVLIRASIKICTKCELGPQHAPPLHDQRADRSPPFWLVVNPKSPVVFDNKILVSDGKI